MVPKGCQFIPEGLIGTPWKVLDTEYVFLKAHCSGAGAVAFGLYT